MRLGGAEVYGIVGNATSAEAREVGKRWLLHLRAGLEEVEKRHPGMSTSEMNWANLTSHQLRLLAAEGKRALGAR